MWGWETGTGVRFVVVTEGDAGGSGGAGGGGSAGLKGVSFIFEF